MKTSAPEARVDSRAKFTVRGWCFLASAVLFLAAATWLGRKDVLALSLFLGMVPLLSSLAMWIVRPRVLLKRSVDPPLVTLGDAAQVALRVRRRSASSERQRTRGAGGRTDSAHETHHPASRDLGAGDGGPIGDATVADHGRGTDNPHRERLLDAGRTSTVAAVDVHETVDPLLGRDQNVSVPVSGTAVTYTVRPRRRGIHELGPATVRVGDPFGVVTELLDVAERTSLYVAPEPEDLTEHGATTAREFGNDPSRRAQPQPGPDNVMTREYRHGDPMRRVHWAASAKHGQLMVRQEDPRSTRSTVMVLDSAAQHWPGARVWAGVLESTEEFEWAVRAAASVLEHLTRRETVVHALDDQGHALPRGESAATDLRDTDVTDDTATEVVHGLSRAALVSRSEPEERNDPLTERLNREGLFHPLLLLTGRLSPEAARRYVTAAAASTACSVIMVIDAPAQRPDSAAVFEAAGWSVVLVTRWTDVDAAWLATTRGATLLSPPPPEPGTRQLDMHEMMGHTRGRATA